MKNRKTSADFYFHSAVTASYYHLHIHKNVNDKSVGTVLIDIDLEADEFERQVIAAKKNLLKKALIIENMELMDTEDIDIPDDPNLSILKGRIIDLEKELLEYRVPQIVMAEHLMNGFNFLKKVFWNDNK
jgi:hypothetical protein